MCLKLLLACQYGSTHKYDRGLSRLLHSELHWLDVPERVQYRTNSGSQCTAACTANHRGASQISVYQCPTSQQGSIFDPLLGVSWWFRDAGSAHSVHGPSLWPARRFGLSTRRIYFHCTEAFSVLEMFQDDTLYKLTYLLTVCCLLCQDWVWLTLRPTTSFGRLTSATGAAYLHC